MFHIKYPVSKTFFTWDEMGCLCRALGFQANMIQVQHQAHREEIPFDDKGISMKNIQRIFELNLLYKALHRTFNMHTADWNCCVISKSLHLLSHKALSFEELHNVRVAYLTYEHIDMKGMPLVKHTLLRTLKMCGRTIAPMKLMHRLKHMKGQFEEKGRIQLYEFFDLILWCDVYTSYKPEEMETSSGKDDELFRLVDFKRLLSHHDQRVGHALDQIYLKEEWDFGMESLGPKTLFKEPVVSTQARVEQEEEESIGLQTQEEAKLCQEFLWKTREEAQFDKKNYQGLKTEVNQAQRRVYRAHAGTVRPRPISAPDVEKYRRTAESTLRSHSTAQEAYETVQKRLHSAPSRSSTSRSADRPVLPEHARVHTPSVVTSSDMMDVQLKIANLDFDINTLDVRCQLQVEKEMEFYIPEYPEKLANRKPEVEPVPEPERKKIHWTSKIINNLAYPASNLKPAHARNCDARFRGWNKVNKRQGYHTVITSNFHENSEKGRMYAKMEQTAIEPVQYLHPDYVIRHTPRRMADPTRLHKKHIPKPSGDVKSILSNRTSNKDEGDRQAAENGDQVPKIDIELLQSKYLKDEQSGPKDSTKNTATSQMDTEKTTEDGTQRSFPRGLSETPETKAKPLPSSDKTSSETGSPAQPSKSGQDADVSENVPVPHMEHSKAKRVGVGHIGTISLLESIQESRDLEEKLDEESSPTRSSEVPLCTIDLPLEDSDWTEQEDALEEENVDDAEELNKVMQEKTANGRAPPRPVVKPRRGWKSRSAPTLRERKTSPRKSDSPWKSKKVKPSDKRSSSAGDPKKSSTRMRSIDNRNTSLITSTTTSSQSTYREPLAFSGLRGSVTSDENDTKNDDVSEYSEAMTFESSVGLLELASPSPRRGNNVSSLPGINIELDDTRSYPDVMDWTRHSHRVQFDSMLDVRRMDSPKALSLDIRHTSVSESGGLRFDNRNLGYDDRLHNSDTDLTQKKLSKEIRTRLIGRVENAISPAMKMMLMADSMPILSS